MNNHPEATSEATPDTMPDIMVVDDTPDNLWLLLKVLSKQGYSVRPVTEGPMAIAAAQLAPPDLILLDIKMPGMDGYEVCQQLKADERTRDIPVMFLTVLDDSIDVIKGFELGGIDYVTKPVKVGELLARIENQLKVRSLQQRLMQQEQFLRSIYNGVEAGISVVDVLENGHFRIADVNQTALRMSGLTLEQLKGVDLRQLLPAEFIRRNQQACLEQGIPITREEKVEANGKTIWWLKTHSPLRNEKGEIKQLIGTGVNITARKQAELQLAEKTRALSQTLETLRSAQTDLVRSAKMAALGNLVAGVAHEINTPVGTAITTASTLENATATIRADVAASDLKRSSFERYLETAADCSQLILSNLQRAGELVQSFKQVAVDQSSLKVRSFALKPYLQEVITNLMPTIRQTPHRITLADCSDVVLVSYPGAIAQVITNLLINSLNHAYPANFSGQKVGSLHLSFHQHLDHIIMQYSDDGCGIPLAHQKQIFEPFFTTARELGGSGLGLHLVYNLVTQKLKGTIQVASTPNKGTTFILTLPSCLPPEESSDKSPDESPD
ncbi:MAG: response regulator [Phormidesmis sp.]